MKKYHETMKPLLSQMSVCTTVFSFPGKLSGVFFRIKQRFTCAELFESHLFMIMHAARKKRKKVNITMLKWRGNNLKLNNTKKKKSHMENKVSNN